MKERYPNTEPGCDRPYGGIENLRPESKAAVDAFMS
jgi:arylsulfatase